MEGAGRLCAQCAGAVRRSSGVSGGRRPGRQASSAGSRPVPSVRSAGSRPVPSARSAGTAPAAGSPPRRRRRRAPAKGWLFLLLLFAAFLAGYLLNSAGREPARPDGDVSRSQAVSPSAVSARAEAEARAAELTAARRGAAAAFCAQVTEELRFLDMPGVTLEVSVEPAPLSSGGADRVEFLIAANAGEPPKPIAKIASGGELSRIMLAIKAVLAQVDDIDTLVFDEIDTGISGRAAWKVGIKLRQIAAHRQVLCVTHLAQIAAQGHQHLLIAKEVRDGRTYTGVTPLAAGPRIEELARIVGGEPTAAARDAAREMLEKVSP